MPITLSTNVTYVLTSINVDMVGGVMTCGFTRTVNGASDTSTVVTISGANFTTLLATQASAGQPLSDEITIAIYNYAVSSGAITGTVS